MADEKRLTHAEKDFHRLLEESEQAHRFADEFLKGTGVFHHAAIRRGIEIDRQLLTHPFHSHWKEADPASAKVLESRAGRESAWLQETQENQNAKEARQAELRDAHKKVYGKEPGKERDREE